MNDPLCIVLAVLLLLPVVAFGDWPAPAVKLPGDLKHPYVAATSEELERVKAAYQATGLEHDVVAGLVKAADDAIAKPIVYPPRGGQHNQWYQCDKCQVPLKTLDDTHHQCPKCGKVYSGEPYDDVLFARVHSANLEAARNEAWAFAITGDRKYADASASILKGYAERYSNYPYHDNYVPAGKKPGKTGGHLYEQTLDEAMAVAVKIAPAYDLIYDALSPDDRKQIEQYLIRPMLDNIEKNHAGQSNWQTWHNAAFITGGAVIGDEAWVKRAIDDPQNGLLFQLKKSVTDDGMWYENSWGYHFYTLQAMTTIAEQGRRLGIDLWGNPRLKSMYTIAFRYAMPDGSLPRWGDDVNSSVRKNNWVVPAAAACHDPALAAQIVGPPTFETILLGQPTVDKPKLSSAGSEVFHSAGHAILRTDGEAHLAAAITFAPFGGFHGHFDKLSFVFYGYGQELGVDPGRAASQAYRLPIHKNWYRATVAHNAVVVDGQSQEGAEGKLLAFASNEKYAAVLTECNTAYKGVDQRRLLLLTPDYLLVVDHLTADQERRFDWLYHNRGTGVSSRVADKPGTIAEPYVGNEYIQDTRAGKSNQAITVDFAGEVGVHLTFNPQANSEVLTGTGVGKNVDERIPLALLTRRGDDVWFAAVLEPFAKGQQAKAATVQISPDHGMNGASIDITRDGKTERVVFTEKSVQVKSGGQVLLESK